MLSGGGLLVCRPPAFSNDGRKLLVCTANTVSIYTVATALLVTELVGHKGQVTTVIVVPAPANECKCWTSSMDATLRLWDFNTATSLRTLQVSRPVIYMAIPGFLSRPIDHDKKQQLYAFLSFDWKGNCDGQLDDWGGRLKIYDAMKMKEVKGQLKLKYRQQLLVVSPSGKYVGVADRRVIHIWKSPDEEIVHVKEVKKIRLHHIKEFSTLAFHPSDMIVAAGDVTGRILIWRGVGEQSLFSANTHGQDESFSYHMERFDVRAKDDVMSRTTWHWHQSAVNFLSFSSDGAYLYSGAKEGVFVIWQMETGKRRYFPRLGGPLLFFANSPEPSLFSISCADNKILFVNISTMTVEKSIEGIKPPSSLQEKFRHISGFSPAVDYKGGMLVLPAENHTVQFYDLYYDRAVSEVQVSQRNYIPAIETTVLVTLVALSGEASVMGTVEYKLPEEGVGCGYSLKFWAAESGSGKFSLSTVIDEPHSDAGVSDLTFHPWMNMAVSTSYGGNFKIWTESKSISRNNVFGQGRGWRCQSVGSYKGKAMLCAAFSTDGSLLAVGAGGLVTFWNPETNSLVSVIGDSLDSRISSLSFVPRSEHHLVTISKGLNPCLSVWNLSTLSIWWSYQLSVEAVATDPDRPNFAVLLPLAVHVRDKLKTEKDAVIVLFTVEDPIPVAAWAVRKGVGGKVMFIQESALLHEENINKSKQAENRLIFLNRDHEYVVFNPYSDDDDEAHSVPSKRFSSMKDPVMSGYRTMFGNIPAQELNIDKSSHMANQNVIRAPTSHPWDSIFSGPSHVLPPLARVGAAFLESMLEKRSLQEF
uniref:WD repeat-containing protein 75 second beta-propeller domain-containing protein n=1 Tax=Araucaria cunninghamii TaxID=56994 RepID=A0A0D6QW70_ARACU